MEQEINIALTGAAEGLLSLKYVIMFISLTSHTKFRTLPLEHELVERAKRRIERRRTEPHLDPTKTLASFDFSIVSMVSKAHIMALALAIPGSRRVPTC